MDFNFAARQACFNSSVTQTFLKTELFYLFAYYFFVTDFRALRRRTVILLFTPQLPMIAETLSWEFKPSRSPTLMPEIQLRDPTLLPSRGCTHRKLES